MSLGTVAVVVVISTHAAAATPMRCVANYTPPTANVGDHVVRFDFDIAVLAETPGVGIGTALTEASNKLFERLCRLPDKSACEPLRRHIKEGASGANDGNVCAMAIISLDDEEAWQRSLATDIDKDLRDRTTHLLLEGGVKDAKVRAVVIGDVVDGNVPGGGRADWWRERFRSALGALSLSHVDPPRGWHSDDPLPKSAQRLVRWNLIERVDSQSALPVVDATLEASNGKGEWMTAAPITFPAVLAPPGPTRETALGSPNAKVHIHVDKREGGSLCSGDRTNLAVASAGAEPMHVRVIDVDSHGNGIVLFPNEDHLDDVVKPGATVSLSPADGGFEIVGAPGDRERYIVVAAKSVEGLARFAKARGTCRFRPDDVDALRAGKLFAGIDGEVSTDGFTLLDDVACKRSKPPPRIDGTADGIAQLPYCD